MSIQSIHSAKNTRIKYIRKLLADPEQGILILEGIKLVTEAVRSKVKVEQAFLTPAIGETESQLVDALKQAGAELFTVSETVMNVISAVETPPGIVAIAKMEVTDVPPVPVRFGALIVSVRDPGNFGTIIRSAEAARCEFVVHSDCVTPFNPKVIRASMGSILRVPLVEVIDWQKYLNNVEGKVRRYALRPREGLNLFQTEVVQPAVLVIGSESHGLPEKMPADVNVTIPMWGQVESLNTAMAATLCFYWIAHGGYAQPKS